MTLQAAFPMEVSDINIELGRAGNAAFSFIGATERALAGVPAGAINMSDFLGKSNRGITQMYAGGYGVNFAGVPFGATDARRRIVVLMWHGDTGTNPGTTPGCTIDGVGMSRVIADSTGDDSSGSDAIGAAIFVANPGTTSGTIAASWSGKNVYIVVLRLVGYSSVAQDSEKDGGVGSDGILGLLTTAGGCMICAGGQGQGAGTDLVWINITERGEVDASGGGANNIVGWAWDIEMDGIGSKNPRLTPWSAAQGSNVIVGCTFPPL